MKIILRKKEIEVNVGDSFNYFTILDIHTKEDEKKLLCDVKCKCGKILNDMDLRRILREEVKSCGCYAMEILNERNIKHNESKTRLYKIWVDMRRRCNNPNRKRAKSYYLKGIRVCDEWNNWETFKEWALKNGYDDTLSIERIDNSKNYCPENCKWIPKSEQSKNRDFNNNITYKGETHTLTDWSKKLGINRTTLSGRFIRGWTVEQAFETPLGTKIL
jgi:ORF019